MQTTKLKVNWSTSVTVITLTTSVVLLVATGFMIKLLYDNLGSPILNAVFVIIVMGTFLYLALQLPRYIILTDDKLIVKKLFGTFSIERSKIKHIESYMPDSSEIRLFGSSGLFGYLGKFSNAKIGSYRSFVCDFKQAFLIQTFDRKNYVFSCENRDLIISQLKK